MPRRPRAARPRRAPTKDRELPFLTDAEIDAHIAEPKALAPASKPACFKLQSVLRKATREWSVDLHGLHSGHSYRLIAHENRSVLRGFSVILTVAIPGTTERDFRLLRYDCSATEHRNPLQDETFTGCHIHKATERYQKAFLEPDKYARPTNRFHDLTTAVHALWKECSIIDPLNVQPELIQGAVL